MANKIIRTILVVLFSALVTLLIFILLSYTRIANRLINYLMVITGDDFYQGETRSEKIFNYLFCLLAFLFLIVLYLSSRFVFKKSLKAKPQ
jgi:hypothetical protein